MSRTSSITIRGQVVHVNNYDLLLDFIKEQGGSVEIDGRVQGAIVSEDGMDFIFEPVNEACPFELAHQLINSGRLSTIDCFFEIGGKQRFFNFDFHFENCFLITINANRRELEDGTTDFTWYHQNLISKLSSSSIIDVESIIFCDEI